MLKIPLIKLSFILKLSFNRSALGIQGDVFVSPTGVAIETQRHIAIEFWWLK